jgi:hypothetical protein
MKRPLVASLLHLNVELAPAICRKGSFVLLTLVPSVCPCVLFIDLTWHTIKYLSAIMSVSGAKNYAVPFIDF